MLEPIVIFLLLFTAIGAGLWSAWRLLTEGENPLEERLEELQSQAMATPASPRRRRSGGLLNTVLYVISLAPGGEDWLRSTEAHLNHAGIRRRSALAVYCVFHALFFAVGIGVMLYLQWNNPLSNKIGGLTGAFLFGWLAPKQVLYRLERRYRRRLQEALPDTVDLLGIVLGTGLALDQAMLRVSDEMRFLYPELSEEFATVVMQVKAGGERSKAFQQLVRRTGIEDIKSLAAMIVQSERFGTSLAQALKVYADALRTRRRLRAEAAVGKAGIKMLFPIVLFILPALFVVTLVPGVLSVLRDLRGGIGPSR